MFLSDRLLSLTARVFVHVNVNITFVFVAYSSVVPHSGRRVLFTSIFTPVANVIKLFTAVITPLAAYFSMILTELRR
jgi:hypothetical protein